MASPLVYLGQKLGTDGPKVYQFNEGLDDDGVVISVISQANLVAPAGAGGECLFTSMYLVLTHSMPVTVRLIPILDGKKMDGTKGNADKKVDIALVAENEEVPSSFEIGLSIPLYDVGTLLTGTVTVTKNSVNVVGVGTLFLTELSVGDKLRFSEDVEHIYTVASITDDLNLVLESEFSQDTDSGIQAYSNPLIATTQGMRGTWYSFSLQTVGALSAGTLIIDEVELEFETVREGKKEVNDET